jgi:DNA-binding response OmpR family regulator
MEYYQQADAAAVSGAGPAVGTPSTCRDVGKFVGQKQLLREVWGPNYESETNYLRVYMAQLRRKLERDPAHPQHLLTEPGMGYRFEK